MDLDKLDRKILNLLQTEAGISSTEIGERVGLSQSACWRRMQRLREAGIIRDQPIILDREKVGLKAMVFAQVKLSSQGRSNLSEFARAMQEFPEVLECYVLMGSTDFLLRIVTADIQAYERFFFDKLSQIPGVQEVTSSMALSEIKHSTVLPL